MRLPAIGMSFFVAGMIIGCSDVGFKSVPSATCTNFNRGGDQVCTFTPDGNVYSVNFKTGLIDILIVNDNSGSMSREQAKMADAFSGFLNSISDFDYQIAMVTTDMESGNGSLVTFEDEDGNTEGEKVLVKGATNIESKFRGTIQREETFVCDSNRYAAEFCPSTDERGIYAANTAISRNESGWLRNGAHTVIIALTDESQRSSTGWNEELNDWEGLINGKPLESVDRPETLVTNFTSRYATKSLSVHPIIVRPGDSQCLASQLTYFDLLGRPLVFPLTAKYGNLWNELANASASELNIDANGNSRNIVDGTVGSICSSNYYSQLNLIGSFSAANAGRNEIQMQCLPDMEDITIEADQDVNYYIDTETNRIVFENLPVGLQVRATWVCDNNI